MPGGLELVGRERERSALPQRDRDRRGGGGGLLLVAGEGGVGKTALVESALAEAGRLVLRGGADQRAVRPYAPIVAALRAYQRTVPDGLQGSGPLSRHLALILPELGAGPPETDQATLFEAVGNVFEWISGRDPTVVFLDDLQWADGATAELLLHLDRTLETAPVLVLGAYRSDEVSRGHRCAACDRSSAAADACRSSPSNRSARWTPLPSPPGSLGLTLGARLPGRCMTAPRACRSSSRNWPSRSPPPDGWRRQQAPWSSVPRRPFRCPTPSRRPCSWGRSGSRRWDATPLRSPPRPGFDSTWSCWPPSAAPTASTKRSSGDSWWRWTSKARSATPSSARPSTTTHHGPDGAPTTGGWRRSWRGAAPEAVAEQWLAGGERDRARPSLLAAAERFCQVHAYHDAARAVRRALELWPDGQGQVAGSGVTADPSNRFG